MNISEINLEDCILRKEDPEWRFALGAKPTTEGVIVSIKTEEGLIGYGYASATPHMGSNLESLNGTLLRLIPFIKEHDTTQMSSIRIMMERMIQGNNQNLHSQALGLLRIHPQQGMILHQLDNHHQSILPNHYQHMSYHML